MHIIKPSTISMGKRFQFMFRDVSIRNALPHLKEKPNQSMKTDGNQLYRHCGCVLILICLVSSKNIEEPARNVMKLHEAYMKDLIQHGVSNVLVTDEMGYLHDDTLEYIMYKIHQILFEELAKQSVIQGKLGSGVYELIVKNDQITKDNESEKHRIVSSLKYQVLKRLNELYINIFLKQIPQLRENIRKEIYNIDFERSKKLLLHVHWEFQDSFNGQVSLLSKVIHNIIRKVVNNIETSWYKANLTNTMRLKQNHAKIQFLKS